MQIVKELDTTEVGAGRHSTRRIVVLQREDGWYAYAEQYYFVSKYDGEVIAEGWHTLPADGVYATSQLAEAEGRAAFAQWHGLAD